METEVGRKVGRHHLAFYRGWLQGLALGDMADRYLEITDMRRAKTTLAWLRDVIQQAALRHGNHGMARLLRLKVQIAVAAEPEQAASPLPSLAQFREEFDPDGFYTEKELIESYQEAYPQTADDKARRRQNIIQRQLRALSWVEDLLATDPNPEDLVGAWFDPPIAKRLQLAGIPNLKGLIAHINQNGHRWWKTVPKMGAKGAERIIRWFQTYEATLGVLPEYATTPLRQLMKSTAVATLRPTTMGIVPLEALLVPSDLDGSTGTNRHHDPKIEAKDDMQAINACLAMKRPNKNTQASYRMEAERFVLWAIMERRKALSDLTVDDCAAYRDWLSMLGRTPEEEWTFRMPQSEWMQATKGKALRHTDGWRPFSVALTPASIKRALGVLKGMFDWLVSVQYLAFNPWSAVPLVLTDDGVKPPDQELKRMLTVWQVQYLEEYLQNRPPSPGTHQLRFAITFAFSTGLRRAELVSATTGRLYSMPRKDEPGVRWALNVLGKRNKWRAIPMTDSVMEMLGDYLESRGLNRDPAENPPDTPLIASQSGGQAISQDAIYKAFRGVFAEVADKLDKEGKRNDAKTFRKATTHWMRHTFGSYQANQGTPAVMLQNMLGHASLVSTAIYTHSTVEDMWDVMSKNDLLGKKKPGHTAPGCG